MRRAALVGAMMFSAAACDAATADPGLRGWLFLEGAQYVPGRLPEPRGGPRVEAARTDRSVVERGTRRERLVATLGKGSTAALVGIEGDRGHFVVVALPPDPTQPDLPTIELRLSLSATMPTGPFALLVAAVDAEGHAGPQTTLRLTAGETRLQADLVVTLSWDTNADLDLHVIDPNGVEIWAGNPNSYAPPAPGQPPAPPDAFEDGGILDFDSNASCEIDGRRRENVYWAESPPQGKYVVRVDVPSLCDAPTAHWNVTASAYGERLARAEGVAQPSDSRESRVAGAGVTALEFGLDGRPP